MAEKNPFDQFDGHAAGNPFDQFDTRAVAARGPIGEIANQFKAGVVSDLPLMAGQAMQYVSSPGNSIYDYGKRIADTAKARGEQPDLQPDEAGHNIVTNTLAAGARMIPQSVVPAAVAGVGLASLPVSAPVALGGAAVLGSLPASLSQGQQTLDKATAAGIPEEDARAAARKTALIEGAGETLGTIAGGKLLGIGGKALGPVASRLLGKAETTAGGRALEGATSREVLRPFAAQFPKTLATEVGTEMGQNAGEAYVEQQAGIDKTTPWESAKQAIAPTIGMTALLAPFGLAGHSVRAHALGQRADVLASHQADPAARAEAAQQIQSAIAEADPEAARNFVANATFAIRTGQPLTIDENLLKPQGPMTKAVTLALPAPVVRVDGEGRAKMDGIPAGAPDEGQANVVGRAPIPGEPVAAASLALPAPIITVNQQSQAETADQRQEQRGAGFRERVRTARAAHEDVTDVIPHVPQSLEPIDIAAHAGATSPHNDRPQPTDGQKGAGNYPMGHDRIGGMGISFENAEGSTRSGTAPDGKPWQTTMTAHYGYLKGTKAADSTDRKKQGIDVFVKPGTPKDFTGPVFVVDQVDPKTGAFDEHKALLGFDSLDEAKQGYLSNYEPGWKGLGAITQMDLPAFKKWAYDGKVKSDPLALKAPDGTHAVQIEPTPPTPAAAVPEPDSAANGPAAAPAVAAGDAGVRATTADSALKTYRTRTQAGVALKRAGKGYEVAPLATGGFVVRPVENPAATPVEVKPLSLGTTPKSTEPVTVKDGVIHIGKHPAVNFDTGEPIAIKADASEANIRRALKDGGALSTRQKFFGGAGSVAAQPRQESPTTRATAAQSAHFGQGGTPISEGGKPFENKLQAERFRKDHQPQSRVIKAEDGKGFVLREPSDAEMAARKQSGNRLQAALRAKSYEANPMLTFLAEHGLYHEDGKPNSMKAEFSPDAQINVRGYGNVFRSTGKQTDVLAEQAREEGYIKDSSDVAELEALIARAIRGERIYPQYAEGAVEKEMQAHIDANPELHDLVPTDLDESGYERVDDALQAEVRHLIAQAEAGGIDIESLLEKVATSNENASTDDYHAAARTALEAALAEQASAGAQDRGGPAGAQASEPQASQEVAPDNSTRPGQSEQSGEQGKGETPGSGKAETPLEDDIVVSPGKGLIKGKFLSSVDDSGTPGGPWNTEAEARAAAEAWRSRLEQSKAQATVDRARKYAFAQKLRDGHQPTAAEVEAFGLRARGSDLTYFIPTAADLFGISSRAVRPLVKDLIRVGYTDMGAKRESVNPMKALAQMGAPEGLTNPTPEDILAQQERAQQGERDLAKFKASEEARAQADAQRGDFTLTGSDRATDANPDQGGLFANEPTLEYTGNYETDLFGGQLPKPAGAPASAKPAGTGVRGNVQRAGKVLDTEAPQGDYFVNTVVGQETSREIGASRVLTPEHAAQATRYLYKSAVERFDGIVTDSRGRVLAIIGGFKGATSQASVYPATLMGEAVRIPGARHIWFSHNHPSGTPNLSRADEALNQTLKQVFAGSGIESKGLLAIAGDRFGYIDASGDAWSQTSDIAPSTVRKKVPVIERSLVPSKDELHPVSDLSAAMAIGRAYYERAKAPGLMLLDSQNKVVAWVPITDQMKGQLRGTGGLNSIYRALSQSNAAAAVIVHAGELDASMGMQSIVWNIAHSLGPVDVRAIDAVNVKTGVSLAQMGLLSSSGPMFSKGDSPAAGMSRAQFADALAETFGSKVADRLQAAGVVVPLDQSTLPAHVVPFVRSGNTVYGLYDPNTDRTYAVLQNLTPDMVKGLVLHEVGVHYGFEAMLGKQKYGQVISRIGALGRMGHAEVLAAREQARKEAAAPSQVPEETLAYLVQHHPGMGLVRDVIAAIKAFLFKHFGILGNRLSVDDIAALARSAVLHASRTEPGSRRPDFARDSELMFSRAQAIGDLNPDQEQALSNVGGIQPKQTIADRFAELRANIGVKIRMGLVDQFAPIKSLDEKAYILSRMSKGADGTMEAAMLYGRPYLRDGVPDVNIADGGFAKVLASLKGEHDRWLWWIASKRAELLKRPTPEFPNGRENLFGDTDITALKTLDQGNFADGTPRAKAYADAERDLEAFNQSVLKVALESGLITQEAFDVMKGQPYVPFYRLMENGDMPRFTARGGLVNQSAYKKLKGGTEKLNNDLLQNMLMNWSNVYTASARNRAAQAAMESAVNMAIAYPVPADTKGAVKVKENGVDVHYVIEDPYLMQAVSALHYVPSELLKPLAAMKHILTLGVTANPAFKIRNLIRDSIAAIGTSDLGYNPLANIAAGWKGTAKQSQVFASMLAAGGVMRFGSAEDSSRVRRQIERVGGDMLDQIGWKKLTGQVAAVWEAYQELGDRGENVNRVALYKQLVTKGHSHAEAAFMARDLMDFSMSGQWGAVRFLAQTVPFFNARLQGLYKIGRAASDDPRKFAVVAGAVSLTSLGLMMAYGGDDDWKKREDWDRDAYWWFKIGDKAFRIPKPFEIGAIGTLAERSAELAFSKEMTGARYRERLSNMLFQTFSFDPTPQIVKPLVDIYANKDSFTGRPVESAADQRLRPEDRTGRHTSEVGQLLGMLGLPDPVQLAKGNYTALSPKQIDFMLRGYFGWMGTAALTVSDYSIRPLTDRGARPALQLRDVFLAGNFVETLPTDGSRYVSAMYEQSKAIEQAYGSWRAAIKRGDQEAAAKIMQDEGPKIRLYHQAERIKRDESNLGAQERRVEGSKTMTADEKRERLSELERRRDQLARQLQPIQ